MAPQKTLVKAQLPEFVHLFKLEPLTLTPPRCCGFANPGTATGTGPGPDINSNTGTDAHVNNDANTGTEAGIGTETPCQTEIRPKSYTRAKTHLYYLIENPQPNRAVYWALEDLSGVVLCQSCIELHGRERVQTWLDALSLRFGEGRIRSRQDDGGSDDHHDDEDEDDDSDDEEEEEEDEEDDQDPIIGGNRNGNGNGNGNGSANTQR